MTVVLDTNIVVFTTFRLSRQTHCCNSSPETGQSELFEIQPVRCFVSGWKSAVCQFRLLLWPFASPLQKVVDRDFALVKRPDQ